MDTQVEHMPAREANGRQRKRSRRAVLLAGGGLGVTALLGGAAYVASSLTRRPQALDGGAASGSGTMAMQGASAGVPVGGAAGRVPKSANIKNAPEIPATSPDVQGVFSKREDNSIFLGTGNVTLGMPPMGASGGVSAETDGPEVEVVITRNTQLFKDTTSLTWEAIESGKEIQQQVQRIGSLDDLAEQLDKASGLSVWGTRAGDRTIATTVLFRPPVLISAPTQ